MSTNGPAPARMGSLSETCFERLLFEAFLAERTCALEIRKRQIRKTLQIDRGAPIDCHSTLVSETLGQFLLGRDRISNAELKDCLSEAAARETRIDELLLERSLLTPEELADARRQNLAFKLLECFTWQEGEYRILPWLPEPGDVPAIDTARVVFTGICKFVPAERVNAALGPLLEHPLALTDQSRIALQDLRMTQTQGRLLRKLRQPTDPHALFQDEENPRDELGRTLYACSVMGMVAPLAPEVAALVEPVGFEEVREAEAISFEDACEEEAIEVDTSTFDEPEPWALRDEIAAEYRDRRSRGPADLFGLDDEASPDALRGRYVELCRRYAPERFEHPTLLPVAEMAAELLHDVTGAYELLRGRDPQRDLAEDVVEEAAEARERTPIAPDPRRLAGEYARQARERMASGNYSAATGLLTLALAADPTNRTCRVELAYARFREFPERAAESLVELEGLLQAAPKNVLAHLYTAEVSHAVEDFERAATHFRAGCELWERERG